MDVVPPVRTLGIDPTSRKALGWCLVQGDFALRWGQIDTTKIADRTEDGIGRYLAREVEALIRDLTTDPDLRPEVVAIEKPVASSGKVNHYLDLEATTGTKATAGQVTGSFAATIDVGIGMGTIIGMIYTQFPGLEVIRVNPASAKRQYGGMGGTSRQQKHAARAAARQTFAESLYRRGVISDHTQCKLPREHEADALFIGFVGAQESRNRRWSAALATADVYRA